MARTTFCASFLNGPSAVIFLPFCGKMGGRDKWDPLVMDSSMVLLGAQTIVYVVRGEPFEDAKDDLNNILLNMPETTKLILVRFSQIWRTICSGHEVSI